MVLSLGGATPASMSLLVTVRIRESGRPRRTPATPGKPGSTERRPDGRGSSGCSGKVPPPGPSRYIGTPRVAGPGAIWVPPGPIPPGFQVLTDEPGASGIPPGPGVGPIVFWASAGAFMAASRVTASNRRDMALIPFQQPRLNLGADRDAC